MSPAKNAQEKETLPPLENGEHLDQRTIHERYEAMPHGTRSELAVAHDELGYVLTTYRLATPGIESASGPTSRMGTTFEPQPDHVLFVREEHGGVCRRRGRFFVGRPDLAAEVAASSESIDLHDKLEKYERGGVVEYVVAALRQRRFHRSSRIDGALAEQAARTDGGHRSLAFPGLRLDRDAILAEDLPRALAALQRGPATPEHAAFVAPLASHRTSPSA